MPIVLIVDDDDVIRSALRRALEDDGYEILEAASGEAALALVRDRPVDLIFSDHMMPGMSGLDFLRAAAGARPDALRVMLTAAADPRTIFEAISEGSIHRYVQKPWDGFELRAMARLALREREALRSGESAMLRRSSRPPPGGTPTS